MTVVCYSTTVPVALEVLGSCNISSINLVKSKLVQSDLWVCRVLAVKYCAIQGLYDSGLPLQVLRQVPGAL